jgi:hypothetical protein
VGWQTIPGKRMMVTTPAIDPLLAQVQAWAGVANAIGTLGILSFLVIAFYKGEIISKPVYDKLVDKLVDGFVAQLDQKFHTLETNLRESTKPRGGGGWS